MNRYTQYSQSEYAKPWELPFNELNVALASKQHQQDVNTEDLGKLSALTDNIKSLDTSITPYDRIKHQEVVKNLNDLIYNTSRQNLTSDEGYKSIQEAKRKVRELFGPQGDAYKITERYNKYNTIKDSIEKDPSLKDSPQVRDYFSKSINVPVYDPNDKNYNAIAGQRYVTPIAEKEIQTWADQSLQSVAKSQLSPEQFSQFQLDPTHFMYKLKTTDGKTFSKIAYALESRLPQGYRESAAQDAKVFGQDPIQELDVFERDNVGQVKKDKDNNPIFKNNRLGRLIHGTAFGGQFYQTDNKIGTYEDAEATAKAKYKAEHPISNIEGTTQGIEKTPISGSSPAQFAVKSEQIKTQMGSILNNFKKLDETANPNAEYTFDDILNKGQQFWESKGISWDYILKQKGLYDQLDRFDNISKERDKYIEEQAVIASGFKPEEYAKAKSNLPEIQGFDKNSAINILQDVKNLKVKTTGGSPLSGTTSQVSYELNGKKLSTQEAQEMINKSKAIINTPEGKQYQKFVDNNAKILKKKSEFYDVHSNRDLEFSSHILGLDKETSDGIFRQLDDAMKQPDYYANWVITSANPEYNGQTLEQLAADGKIDLSKVKSDSQIGVTKHMVYNNPETGQGTLGVRKTIIDDKGRPVELIFTDVTTPEIKALNSSPKLEAFKEWDAAYNEFGGKGEMKSKEFQKYGVRYNFTDNTITLGGLKYPEEVGLNKLAAIKLGEAQGLTESEIRKYIKDIQ